MNPRPRPTHNHQALLFLTILLFVTNLVSAILFISFVKRPVYDELYNMRDVQTYAANRISVSTLRIHKNAAAPGSFIWMAAGVRLWGGDELRAARIASLASWLLLGIGILVGGSLSSFPELWYGSLLCTLVFPHAVISTATVLTEGPSLLFATLGALAWTEFVQLQTVDTLRIFLGLVGGLSLGVAVVCRQYNFALLISAAVISIVQLNNQSKREARSWVSGLALSLMAATAPVILLLLVWKGVTSPSMAAGLSYANYQASMGLNLTRLLAAGFYVIVYLLPLSYSVSQNLTSAQRWAVLFSSLLLGILVTSIRSHLIEPGPLSTVTHLVSRLPMGSIVAFGLLAFLAIYNFIKASIMLWNAKTRVVSCIPLQFALLAILFFVVEQVGVGGNIPFYDRYVLQFAPFLGIIAFSITPNLTRSRSILMVGLSSVSHLLLWSHAFQK